MQFEMFKMTVKILIAFLNKTSNNHQKCSHSKSIDSAFNNKTKTIVVNVFSIN